MATLEQLERALINADKAGDEAAAKVLANEILKLRNVQAEPEDTRSIGERVMGGAKALGTGVAQGAIGLASLPQDLGNWMGEKAGYGLNRLMGDTPEQAQAGMDQVQAVRQQAALVPPSSQDMTQTYEDNLGPMYQPQGTAEEYAQTLGQFAPALLMGPGATLGQGMKAAALPTLLGAVGAETAGQYSEGEWYEPYARFAAGLGGGLLGAGAYNAMATPKAPIKDVSPGAQRRVGSALQQSFPDEQAALQRAAELGDDAMVMNLGDRPAMQAQTIARYPGESATTVKGAVRDQLDKSGQRVAQDWDSAIGPSVSRYENQLTAAKTKAGTSSVYQIAKGRPVDPTPVQAAILREISEAGNDAQSRAALKEIADLMMDPNSGGLTFNQQGVPSIVGGTQQFVGDAGAFVNARQRIGEVITRLGKEVSNSPGDDLYQMGKRTSVGSRLNRIYKEINKVLHQDKTLEAADKVWSTAERTQNAFEFGRTKLLGTGDRVIEPEALAAKLRDPSLTVDERAAILRGLSRRGRADLGDVRFNRNDGKAVSDAIATENNLSRIELAAGPQAKNTVRRMAEREDTFAGQGNRAINNSVTAEGLLGAAEFPSPLLGGKDFASIGQRSLLGTVMEGGARIGNWMTKGAVAAKRAKLAADAAKLLTAKGPQRDQIVRDIMEYANSLPKGHPAKTIIRQAVTPSLAASAAAPRVGN
jgi:hypothetical protein